MEKKPNLKKIFLISMIIALSISALIGIVIFIIGEFEDTQAKILVTTLSFGGYSLTGLCCSTIFGRDNLRPISIVGMIVSVIGLVLMVVGIWEMVRSDDYWKLVFTFLVLAVALGHICLMLLIRPKTAGVKASMIATIVFISLLSLLILYLIYGWRSIDDGEVYFRLVGVVAILDVLGTIVTPIMNVAMGSKSPTGTSDPGPGTEGEA